MLIKSNQNQVLFCFLLFHETKLPPTKTQYLEVDLLSSSDPAQSASEKYSMFIWPWFLYKIAPPTFLTLFAPSPYNDGQHDTSLHNGNTILSPSRWNSALDNLFDDPSHRFSPVVTPHKVMVLVGKFLLVYDSFIFNDKLVLAIGIVVWALPPGLHFRLAALLVISLFSTHWDNFFIWASLVGSQHSTSTLIHGLSPFTNVSSNTSFCRCGNGATSLSNKLRYSSMVVSCLMAKNLP